MTLTDTLVTFSILIGLFLIVYSKVKNQDLKDSIEEVKDLIAPASIEPGVMP